MLPCNVRSNNKIYLKKKKPPVCVFNSQLSWDLAKKLLVLEKRTTWFVIYKMDCSHTDHKGIKQHTIQRKTIVFIRKQKVIMHFKN